MKEEKEYKSFVDKVLSPIEKAKFEKSKSKTLKFELGGGIGIGVSYLNKNKKWVDITDYNTW